MSDHMCPGASACPDCDPEGYAGSLGGGDGLTPGQAGRIADSILSAPVGGRDAELPFYKDDKAVAAGNRRRPSGIPYGYGDPRIG